MKKTYVCVGGMRNGKSYHRALNLAQTIMQEYPNQSICVVSLDDYKKALADERRKLAEWIECNGFKYNKVEAFWYRTHFDGEIFAEEVYTTNELLNLYEKESK